MHEVASVYLDNVELDLGHDLLVVHVNLADYLLEFALSVVNTIDIYVSIITAIFAWTVITYTY